MMKPFDFQPDERMSPVVGLLHAMVVFILAAVFIVVISGCNSKVVLPRDIENIQLELLGGNQAPNGLIYTIKLSNQTDLLIKQNNVYLSFPIKTESGSKGNEFKIEAKNNKLNIKPGEEVLLTVFAPKEMYEGNPSIEVENPTIEINGYFNEVEEQSRFAKIRF